MIKRLIVVFGLLATCGCGQQSGPRYIATRNGEVEFKFPAGWGQSIKNKQYDLQCFSSDKGMNTGIMLYLKENISEDLTPEKLFEFHINDLKSKRKSFKVFEEKEEIELSDKKITHIIYSGEKDQGRFYYVISLIEFNENPGKVIIALQVSLPSEWKKNRLILEGITKSARLKKD